MQPHRNRQWRAVVPACLAAALFAAPTVLILSRSAVAQGINVPVPQVKVPTPRVRVPTPRVQVPNARVHVNKPQINVTKPNIGTPKLLGNNVGTNLGTAKNNTSGTIQSGKAGISLGKSNISAGSPTNKASAPTKSVTLSSSSPKSAPGNTGNTTITVGGGKAQPVVSRNGIVGVCVMYCNSPGYTVVVPGSGGPKTGPSRGGPGLTGFSWFNGRIPSFGAPLGFIAAGGLIALMESNAYAEETPERVEAGESKKSLPREIAGKAVYAIADGVLLAGVAIGEAEVSVGILAWDIAAFITNKVSGEETMPYLSPTENMDEQWRKFTERKEQERRERASRAWKQSQDNAPDISKFMEYNDKGIPYLGTPIP